MKKIFLVTGILIATTFTSIYAQGNIDDNNVKEGGEKNQNAVSEYTQNQFVSDFPNATDIHFEKTKGFDKVYFGQNGKETTAYYDYNNQLVGTISKGSFHDLTSDAQAKILDKYPNYSVEEVLLLKMNSDNESYNENNTDLTLYGNSFEKASNYFVELKNDNNEIVLEVGLSSEVSFFKTIK
ncbi:MAG TPA: hypothetical protein VGZ90_04140 [Puia sp.]|jgi:hypothetical protein|nr:hypothetical protein [Puia sp.]